MCWSWRVLSSIDVPEKHVDNLVGVASPAVTAGFVGNLLADQASDQGSEDVPVGGVGGAGMGEQFAAHVEEADRQLVRLGGRLEGRHGAFEQQLGARQVGGA